MPVNPKPTYREKSQTPLSHSAPVWGVSALGNSNNITEKSGGDSRHFALDVMRVIACFMVIVVHVASADISGGGFDRLSRFDWLSMLAVGTIARPAMPLFIMLSGALMLHYTREHYGKYLAIKTGKLVGLYLTFALGYIGISIALDDGLFNEARLLPDLLGGFGLPYFHLYFLLILLGLYLITPLLSAIRHLSTRTIIIGIAGLGALTNADLLLREYQNVALGNLSLHDRFIAYLPYYLLGYIVVHRWGGSIRHSGIIALGCIIAIMIACYTMTANAGRWNGNMVFSYENLLVVALSIAIFGLLYRFGQWCEKRVFRVHKKALVWMGKQSVWVYLIHVFVLRMLQKIEAFGPLAVWFYQPVKALMLSIAIMVICYAIIYGCQIIGRGLRHTLGGLAYISRASRIS